MQTYTTKFAAKRAATKAHGEGAFEITKVGPRQFTFTPIPAEPPIDHPKAMANSESWDAIPDKGTPSGAAKKGAGRPLGKRAQAEADARAGKLPAAPDFSAATHKPYRKRLAETVALVDAGDIAALEAMEIKTYSSSPKAIARYRDLAVLALKARAGREEPDTEPAPPAAVPLNTAVDRAAAPTGRADKHVAKASACTEARGSGATPAPAGKRLTDMNVDEYNATIIAEATSWTATRKTGPGRYDRREASSEAEAREIAETMGQGAMIYAINEAGRQALVATIR